MSAPPFAYYGGKTTLAERIVAELPDHRHYVEPFAGSLAVLLAKPPSHFETVNDLDHRLMTFWRVLREQPQDLIRACWLTPHSRAEHLASYDLTECDDLETARRVWVALTQGRGNTLRRTGWRHFQDPGRRGPTSMPDYLTAYVDRMTPALNRLYADWHRVEYAAYTGRGNHSEARNNRRTEVLWINREPKADLFTEVGA